MLLNILLTLLGFVILYYGSEWLVKGASSIATHLNLNKVVVGVILVAFGTSSPELFVNSIAAFHGHTDFALTNIAGSNLANLCIGFGLCAVVGRLVVSREKFGIDLLFFGAVPLLIFLPLLLSSRHALSMHLSWVLLLIFGFYLSTAKKRVFDADDTDTASHRLPVGVLFFIVGCVTLYAGGETILRASVSIARLLGISETIIGLTIVAVGTSIPDISASLVAFKRQETAIAIGNLIGSNIFNVLLVTSATLLLSRGGLTADASIVMDYAVVFATSALFAVLACARGSFGKPAGIVTILFYSSYIAYRVLQSI